MLWSCHATRAACHTEGPLSSLMSLSRSATWLLLPSPAPIGSLQGAAAGHMARGAD